MSLHRVPPEILPIFMMTSPDSTLVWIDSYINREKFPCPKKNCAEDKSAFDHHSCLIQIFPTSSLPEDEEEGTVIYYCECARCENMNTPAHYFEGYPEEFMCPSCMNGRCPSPDNAIKVRFK